MLKQAKMAQRATVTVEDRRVVLMAARVRKPIDVAQVPHEQFVRNALKDRMGWPRTQPASQSIKDAAKALAKQLVERDKAEADARIKAKAEADQAKIAVENALLAGE